MEISLPSGMVKAPNSQHPPEDLIKQLASIQNQATEDRKFDLPITRAGFINYSPISPVYRSDIRNRYFFLLLFIIGLYGLWSCGDRRRLRENLPYVLGAIAFVFLMQAYL
jgi:hypothetical protein